MEKTKLINYKETSTKKINQYTWTGIVDCDGFVLKNKCIEVPEFFNWFKELDYNSSQYLIDSQEHERGINKILKSNFFKYVDSERGLQYMQETGREHGRLSRNNEDSNLYVFITMEDALYTNELFSRGVLWMFTSLDNLHNYISYIDNLRILRLNHSFKTLYPDEELEILNFDDVIKNHFILNNSYKTEQSKKWLEQSKKKHIREKPKQEYWDNGFQIIKKETKKQQQSKQTIPDIYDYEFQEYKWHQQQVIKITTKKKPQKTFDNSFELMR